MVGVSAAKDAVYDRLRVKDEGPSYCHFPLGRELEYFEQLTAEKKFVRYHFGFAKHEWRLEEGKRNEALDCRVYAYAGLHSLLASGLPLNKFCEKFDAMQRRQSPAQKPDQEGRVDVEQQGRPTQRQSTENPFMAGHSGGGFVRRPNWLER
jgi:phage terminase large subunit GpA-like protein